MAETSKSTNNKLIASNRRANFEYFLQDKLEVGLELFGTEIKSLRQGKCSLSDSYVMIKNGEAYILNMDIPVYEKGNIFNHEPKRSRKLLMHKTEILKYAQNANIKGYTIIATKCYIKKSKAKLEIALGKGKNTYDKRETIKKRDTERKINQEIKDRNS